MELSPAEQERYSRHLLLDGFDQEKVKDAFVAVRGTGAAARWAARYLAASGVGRLRVEEPAWREELLGLGPQLQLSDSDAAPFVCAACGDVRTDGALAAVEILRQIGAAKTAGAGTPERAVST
jgi:molybdopterin/thiamine biosynthesis adenylyltransferase